MLVMKCVETLDDDQRLVEAVALDSRNLSDSPASRKRAPERIHRKNIGDEKKAAILKFLATDCPSA